MRDRLVRSLATAGVIALLVSGCGGGGKSKAEKERESGLAKAAVTNTCVADAKPADLSSVKANYPADFPLPDGAVAYNAEDRARRA